MPTDIKSYVSYGGEKVVFEADEVKQIKTFGEPGQCLPVPPYQAAHSPCTASVCLRMCVSPCPLMTVLEHILQGYF